MALFLSTLSLRRATMIAAVSTGWTSFLSTLSLRRATADWQPEYHAVFISIHALLAESDAMAAADVDSLCISIHALLAESDFVPRSLAANPSDFYPRSPCGERRKPGWAPPTLPNFYPRSPCGERRMGRQRMQRSPVFLSTLSLRRATAKRTTPRFGRSYFYPRSPCGERRCNCVAHALGKIYFYPRSPCGERH